MWNSGRIINLSADVFTDDNGYDYIIVAARYNVNNENRIDYGLNINLLYFDDNNIF